MPPTNPLPKILGSKGQMPLLEIELPPYVVLKHRGGAVVFYFQVPARLRPLGWPATIRLPMDVTKRSGLADAAEVAAVVDDGDALYRRLEAERNGEPALARINTLPWLIQSFEHAMKTEPRERPIGQRTLDQYAYFARVVIEWSRLSGHPHVKTLSRPGVKALINTMNDTPTKRKHIAGYIRQLMFHAMDLGIRSDNPCIKLKTEVPQAKVHIWSDAEVTAMVEAADEMGYPNIATAILIAHDEGPRPCDVLSFERFRGKSLPEGRDSTLDRGHYCPVDGTFRYFQQKTDGWVISPAGQRVRDRLAMLPDLQRMLIINPNTGKAYNERIFSRDFDRVRTALQLHHLQFRHLRHTFCVKGKRAGLDAIEIASKTGHDPKSVEDMLRKHYLPHDSEVAELANAKIEAYRARKAAHQ